MVGIKLFCGHESFYLSDNILGPVYALAETYNVPVLFHSEKDSSQYASYFAVCEAVRQHPNITFVCCHCHYPNVEACFQRYKNVNNIVFDISSIADVQMTADMRKAVQSELQRHPDAIMFGSDYAGCSQADHLDFAMSLAVSDDIRSRLLYKTAYRVFHLA
ncbi:amidohydrolase family protein [[Clostridium] innocuum]|uniref:amidohydrolase family protein n=1 Tax=Clostridium innocuum TaxID=1522 RepID=UPI00300D214A|nr:amidohydrolase family protein [[Clostridium] innocuum]